MPSPRKPLTNPPPQPLTVEMSGSLLQTVLLKTLQPLHGEIATLRQENSRLQQQLTDSITSQVDTQTLLDSLSKQVLNLIAQQLQLQQTLSQWTASSQINNLDDLQPSLATLVQSLTSLSTNLNDNSNLQQQLMHSLADLSQQVP